MTVSFYTLGCKVNQYESAALQEMMQSKGYCIVDFNSEADVYLVNSCNVTETSEKKSISLVKSIKNKHPDSIVVLTGCFPQAFPDKAKNTSADIVCGTKDRKSILKYIEDNNIDVSNI